MTTHDYSLDNQTFPAFRADLNNVLTAILGLNASATAPTTTTAGMFWYDTANGLIKQRNSADSGWLTLYAVGKQGLIPQDGSTIYAADSVGTDSYAITLSPAPTAYTTGMVVNVKFGTANTNAASLNVNGLGAKTIKKSYNSDLVTGDILANQIGSLIYDGTNFQMLSPTATSSSVYPKGYTNGVVPIWQSNSTVRIPTGFSCRSADNTANIDVTSDLDAVLSASGANGLDTGAEASGTTYYLWVIKKSSDGTVASLWSLSASSPTMPAGYDLKRRIKGAWRNDGSSNLMRMIYGVGYPHRPLCLYDVPMTIGASAGATNVGNTASASYGSYDCTSFAPETITNQILLHVAGATQNAAVVIRPGDETNDFQSLGIQTASGGAQRGFSDFIRIDTADGTFDAKLSTASGTAYMDVKGFIDTLGD